MCSPRYFQCPPGPIRRRCNIIDSIPRAILYIPVIALSLKKTKSEVPSCFRLQKGEPASTREEPAVPYDVDICSSRTCLCSLVVENHCTRIGLRLGSPPEFGAPTECLASLSLTPALPNLEVYRPEKSPRVSACMEGRASVCRGVVGVHGRVLHWPLRPKWIHPTLSRLS